MFWYIFSHRKIICFRSLLFSVLKIMHYSCANESGVVFDICWFYLQIYSSFHHFPVESSKLREEMVLLKTQSTVQLQWKNIVLDKAVCYYSGARFLNEKLFCLEIDCGITSLMLEEMLISSFFVGLIH